MEDDVVRRVRHAEITMLSCHLDNADAATRSANWSGAPSGEHRSEVGETHDADKDRGIDPSSPQIAEGG